MIASLALILQVAMQPPSSLSLVNQDALDAIADACRAPRSWLALRGNELVFRASPDADPAKLECVVKRMSDLLDTVNAAGKRAGK